MIVGLDRFRDFFHGLSDQYVLIGGVAATQWIEAAGLRPRATKDIDIVLIVESLNDQFLARVWEFIKRGRYNNLQKSADKRIYYRFSEPAVDGFPVMLEFFSRPPEKFIDLGDATIIPVPSGDEASSLSAILMDDAYYDIVRNNRLDKDGLPLLTPESLILLKARAWLDLTRRRAEGQKVDERDIKKHRTDIFKLALLLTQDKRLPVAKPVLDDLHGFLGHFPDNSPEWEGIRQSSGTKMPSPAKLMQVIKGNYVIAD